MQAYYFRVENDFASSLGDQLGIFLRHRGVVHNAGRGNLQGPQSAAMRLDFAELFGLEHAQSRNFVRNPALVQLLQPRNFLRTGRDYELAAFLERNSLLPAKALHGSRAGHAVARLQRTGFVIETGVNDPAVVPGLMGRDVIFLLHDENAHSRKPPRRFKGGC